MEPVPPSQRVLVAVPQAKVSVRLLPNIELTLIKKPIEAATLHSNFGLRRPFKTNVNMQPQPAENKLSFMNYAFQPVPANG